MVIWKIRRTTAALSCEAKTPGCAGGSKRLKLWKNLLKVYTGSGLASRKIDKKEGHRVDDNKSLAHTKWNCKYHVIFAPKFRRKIIYGKLKAEIGKILRELCNWKQVNIIEAEMCPDHVHMLVEIPPKISVSGFVGFLKGKSTLLIFERHANLKYKYGNRTFWCRGYYVDTVGKNKAKIAEYIRTQLQEDQVADQISMKEFP